MGFIYTNVDAFADIAWRVPSSVVDENDNRKSVRGYTQNQCRDPGSNRGPLDLQSNALPTELSRPDSNKLRCNIKILCKLTKKSIAVSFLFKEKIIIA